MQVIKVRLMAKEHLGRYQNTLDCLQQVVKQEGLSALFIGLIPTLYRNCIWNCLFYGSVHEIEMHLPHMEPGLTAAARQLAVGTVVGITATSFNAPFDVVKSRFQSQLPHEKRYHHVLPTLVSIAREEGPRALYRGFLPKAVRLGIGQSIGLVMFENLLRLFGVSQEEY
jgi:solute carrier family 25 2-oxodicarboxylate transporter 21